MPRDNEGLPYRRRQSDLERGSSRSVGNEDAEESFDSSDKLRRWRQAALVLNCSHRFRYTLDLKKEEEKQQIIMKLRCHVQVLLAASLFDLAGKEPIGGYGIGPEQLASMMKNQDVSTLQIYGGGRGLAAMLKTDAETGIQGEKGDLLHRRNVFGSNAFPEKKEQTFWRFLLDACRDTALIILMVAAVASLVLGIKGKAMKQRWYDGGSIALAVVISIVVSAIRDYRESLEFQSWNKKKQNIDSEVTRGGRRVKIPICDIVVGDVVHLKIGDMVPADGILISGHSPFIDESNNIGETELVRKDLLAPFLMAGSKMADGYGTMLVTGVGAFTERGGLMCIILEDNGEETPLQVHLNGVATYIGIIGLVLAFLVFVVLMVRYFTGYTKNPDGSVQFRAGKTRVADSMDEAVKIFTVAVSIAIVAVPEGLPLTIILTLTYSVRKMMADKILVRRLSAFEIMGSATTICIDKTGTLTLNLMTVVEAFICGKKIEAPYKGLSLPPPVIPLLLEGIAQNTYGSVFMPESGEDVVVSGSPTEKAILQWGLNLGMNFDAVRSDSSVIHVCPFNSEKKRAGVVIKLPDSKVHIHWKGAAEMVLALCTRYIDADGCLVPMNEDKVTLFKKAIEDMAVRSLRCLALAFLSYELENIPSDEEKLANWDLPEGDLILLAIVGLKDPCRPDVRDAVELCMNAGVKVCMVTGDNVQTAITIALECGILGTDADATEPNVIEGRVFHALSDLQRQEIADKILVMGRSSPNDKLLLVQALRECGHIVAVTGDGTNDAPALHEADIGLAMGIQGTQVAIENSDVVILDDNFASIVKVIQWGRSVYANIQKFVQFQLTLNVAAVLINVLDAFSSGEVPYNAVQLLWVNIIMDTLGLLALATERPTDNLMDRNPIGRRAPLITYSVWRNLLTQVLYQVTLLLVLNSRFRSMLNLEHDRSDQAAKVKNTLIFNAFIFCQIFNEFNARKPDGINVFKGITKNHFFIGIVGLTIVLQVIIITFLGKFTSSVRLNLKLWLLSILFGFISWLLMTIVKLIPVPKERLSKFILTNPSS